MSSLSQRVISPNRPSGTEAIINFSPRALRAPFFLRCAALCIDYIVLLTPPVGWLVFCKLLSESGSTTIGTTVWVLGIILFLINFLLLPLIRGQTLGKMVAGLTILNLDGSPVALIGLVKRNILGYFATILTLGLGFLISAVNTSGRSLHDFIAGTIVVSGRKTQV
ncbi:MAG: RDD family protein [Pyrinomonadaceae bacterium]